MSSGFWKKTPAAERETRAVEPGGDLAQHAPAELAALGEGVAEAGDHREHLRHAASRAATEP